MEESINDLLIRIDILYKNRGNRDQEFINTVNSHIQDLQNYNDENYYIKLSELYAITSLKYTTLKSS